MKCKVCSKDWKLDSVFFPSEDKTDVEMVHEDCIKHLKLSIYTHGKIIQLQWINDQKRLNTGYEKWYNKKYEIPKHRLRGKMP